MSRRQDIETLRHGEARAAGRTGVVVWLCGVRPNGATRALERHFNSRPPFPVVSSAHQSGGAQER